MATVAIPSCTLTGGEDPLAAQDPGQGHHLFYDQKFGMLAECKMW